MSALRWSGSSDVSTLAARVWSSTASHGSSASTAPPSSNVNDRSATACRRQWSISLLRATVISHPTVIGGEASSVVVTAAWTNVAEVSSSASIVDPHRPLRYAYTSGRASSYRSDNELGDARVGRSMSSASALIHPLQRSNGPSSVVAILEVDAVLAASPAYAGTSRVHVANSRKLARGPVRGARIVV